MHAMDIENFTKDGNDWVRFTVEGRYGKKGVIEREVIRETKIKTRKKTQVRYVVNVGICLGNRYQEEEVSLFDRSNFEHELILGRAYLAGVAIIDPSSVFAVQPACTECKNCDSSTE
jgi:hypothetical protein